MAAISTLIFCTQPEAKYIMKESKQNLTYKVGILLSQKKIITHNKKLFASKEESLFSASL